jgi:hypothetical protein
MVVDCDATTPRIEGACHHALGEQFQLQVSVTEPPDGAYDAFQTRLRWPTGTLRYAPTASVSGEFVWPDCGIAARAYLEVSESLHGCSMFGGTPSRYTGPVLRLQFECLEAGSTTIDLVPGSPLDSHFLDNETSATVPSALGSATIVCVE